MRQLYIIPLVILVLFAFNIPANAAYKGGITYSIPIEYKNLSETELKIKAESYFSKALQSEEWVLNSDFTNALNLYNILLNINPKKVDYVIKLGILYDKLGKDRQAKGNFARAIGIDPSKPGPYFYYGEFYYRRELYRQALKYYQKALERANEPSYALYFRLGDIYEKFGDTKQALQFYQQAQSISPNEDMSTRIKRTTSANSTNNMYYRK